MVTALFSCGSHLWHSNIVFFPSPIWLQLKTILNELFRNFFSLSHAFSSCIKSWNQVVKQILPSPAQVLKVIAWFRKQIALLLHCNSVNFHWRFIQAGKSTLAGTIQGGINNFREWDNGAHSSLAHAVFSSPLKTQEKWSQELDLHYNTPKLWGRPGPGVDSGVFHSHALLSTQRFVSLPSLLLSCGPRGSASISVLVTGLDFDKMYVHFQTHWQKTWITNIMMH